MSFKKLAFSLCVAVSVGLSLSVVAEERRGGRQEENVLPAPAPENVEKGKARTEEPKNEEANREGDRREGDHAAREEKKINYDINASELTLEDKGGNGLFVVCKFSSFSSFRGGFLNGEYQSSGWGNLEDKIGGACRGCLESRTGHCRFSGCTAKEYYTNRSGERVYAEDAAVFTVLLDKSIDTSCEPGKKVDRVIDESAVALEQTEGKRGQAAPQKGQASNRSDVRRDPNGYTHSFGYSQSWESNSSGMARGTRSAYDSDEDYTYHEEWFRPGFPRSPFGNYGPTRQYVPVPPQGGRPESNRRSRGF